MARLTEQARLIRIADTVRSHPSARVEAAQVSELTGHGWGLSLTRDGSHALLVLGVGGRPRLVLESGRIIDTTDDRDAVTVIMGDWVTV